MSRLLEAKCDAYEMNSVAEVRQTPIFSGDGYGFGGSATLTIGRFAIPLGEHPDALGLAQEIARRWNIKGFQRRDVMLEDGLREALKDALCSLVAAVSLLESGGKKAAPSDKMFSQMLADYKNSIERARAALAAPEGERTDAN